MRKAMFMVITMILSFSLLLMGCSQRPEGASGNTAGAANDGKTDTGTSASGGGAKIRLTVYNTTSDAAVQGALKDVAGDFMKENPDIQVEFQFPGSEYENILKVKMAANDLPDVFDTHGWAVIRYGKYLADLKDEPWAANLTDTVKPVVTDKDGKVYALVLSEAKDGITYNANVLKQYNIQPPQTFEELLAAAETLKTKSNGEITPFFMSGVDNGMIGQFLDQYATSLFISPQQNDAQSLLDGKFDWNKWADLAQKLLDLKTKGYINKDVLTAKRSDMPTRFAQGKVAFIIGGPTFADEVHKVDPNVKVGIMPLTSMVPGDSTNFSGGERYTMGAWKDGKHLEESKKLIAFFAKPENMTRLANASKLPAGLKDIPSQHEFSEYYDQFASVRVFPYFDRVYLPNGMWDVICKTGTALLAGNVSPQQFADKMESEYNRLRDQ